MSEPTSEPPLDIVALAKEANAWLERTVGPLKDALVVLAPRIAEFARNLHYANERLALWGEKAPDILKRTVSRAGLIVPFSQMSFADIVELIRIYETQGEQAVVERVRKEYGVIFASEDILATLEKSWASHPRFTRRLPILREALKAHELAMFAVSVPTSIAQFEGLVADTVRHEGRMGVTELRDHVRALVANDGAIGSMFSSFVCDAYLDQFAHGQSSAPHAVFAMVCVGSAPCAALAALAASDVHWTKAS